MEKVPLSSRKQLGLNPKSVEEDETDSVSSFQLGARTRISRGAGGFWQSLSLACLCSKACKEGHVKVGF